MSSTCTTMTGALQISLREARLTLDRALLETGMPYGFNHAVRECVLLSEARRNADPARPLGGFARYMALHDSFRQARPDALQVGVAGAAQGSAPLQVDCAGQHAWIVAQMLLDLLLAEHAEREATSLNAIDVADPHELQVIVWLAQRHGATLSVTCGQACSGMGNATLTLHGRRLPPKDAADAALRDVIHHGLPVDASLWWSMYHLALGALAPDNIVSRRHAGANIVDEKGQVIGRPTDDDTDFSLLTRVERGTATAGKTTA
ncbi:hypothetical protein [Pandoraea fibrosis]|uniref:Uncharacterized protein n=1 Tax=Pandoraea fibrosis TaxID=1891094 RepID=A0A5E4VKS2_9BURK|nr:hypothetical protein [Pandoraea fibrosis]VVE12862.1 hypothetical protein PFI31113_02700 [Pandoraea fibrosis]